MRLTNYCKCISSILTSAVVLAPSVSIAQGVSLGAGTRLETSIEGKIEYTDNFYRSATNEVDAMSYHLLPAAELVYRQGSGGLVVGYKGDMAEHDTRSKDDYFDHKLYMNADLRPMTRHAFSTKLQYLDEHDDLGTSRTTGLQGIGDNELDQWNQIDGEIRYQYGAPSATLGWHLRGLLRDREYDTNRTSSANPSAGTRFLDHSANGFGGGVTYNISPRTNFVLDLETRDITYDVKSTPSFDGDFQRYLVGVRWLATAKTSGQFLIGTYNRNFDDSTREDVSNFSWEGQVNWAPKEYSTFTVKTGRTAYENFQLGEDFVDSEYFEILWRHDWRTTIHTEIGGNFNDFSYEGTTREDSNTTWFANLEVQVMPRYLVVLGYRLQDRESSLASAEFDRNIAVLSLKATF